MPLPRGTKPGPYEVPSLIGEGVRVRVDCATDSRLNRTAAIKVPTPHFSDNPDMKERFELEAQTIAGLNRDVNALCWADISTSDADKAEKFYSDWLGWTYETGVDGYRHIVRATGCVISAWRMPL